MRVAEGTRRVERSAHTLERGAGLIPPRVQHALKADEQGLIGEMFETRRQPLFGEIQVSAQSAEVGGGSRAHTTFRVFLEARPRLPLPRARSRRYRDSKTRG